MIKEGFFLKMKRQTQQNTFKDFQIFAYRGKNEKLKKVLFYFIMGIDRYE